MTIPSVARSCLILAILSSGIPGVEADASTAQAGLATKAEQDLVGMISRIRSAFVFIGGGSGVLISADGLMLTNHHVAGTSKRWMVRVDTALYEADVVGSDPRGDITLLKLNKAENLPFVEFADSDALYVGQRVIAIGNPFATAEVSGEPTVTLGIVSALHRFQNVYTDAIQTDAPINPGNSGGPLLTLDGRLAGINGQIANKNGERANSGIGYAIPSAQIRRFLPSLRQAQGGFVYHGIIRGLSGDTREADRIRNGAEISGITAGSWADRLGFKAGDRVIAVDSYAILNYSRFIGVLGTYPPDSPFPVTLVRSGKEERLDITLQSFKPGGFGFLAKQPVLPERPNTNDMLRAMREPVIVDKIFPDLAAAKAGLQIGDVVLVVGKHRVANFFDWRKCLQQLEPLLVGDVLTVKVQRKEDGREQEKTFSITLTSEYEQTDSR